MSRRKPPKPESVLGGSTVAIICTGRRSHKPMPFGEVQVLATGQVTTARLRAERTTVAETAAGDQSPIADKGMPIDTAGSHWTWQFDCAICGRRMPVTNSRLSRAAAALADAGRARLDLSALDRANVPKQ